MRRSLSVLCVGLAAIVASAVLPARAGASTVIFRTDAELVALSERVVHARVLRQRSARPDGPTGSIYTVTTLRVLEDFTGRAGREIEVWELGGIWGDEIMWIGGAVTYEVGSEVMVCLERGRLGLRSVAMGFSKFDVRNGRLTRNLGEYARSSAGRPRGWRSGRLRSSAISRRGFAVCARFAISTRRSCGPKRARRRRSPFSLSATGSDPAGPRLTRERR